MATQRTIDHDQIREWVEKNHGYPAIIAGSQDDETDGELTLSFSDPDLHARHISWDEFFGMFETHRLRFRYDEPPEDGEGAGWVFSFESRDQPAEPPDPDETQLPEDNEMASDNMFPSAPDQSNAGLDLPEAPDLGEELA